MAAKGVTMGELGSVQKHARMLRAWHLAILRFAATLDNADRLNVFSIGNEMDRLGRRHEGKPDFSFFRQTSVELCAAILQPNETAKTILRKYLARIDDARLGRAFAAAIEIDQPDVASVKRKFRTDNALWQGLPSRANAKE